MKSFQKIAAQGEITIWRIGDVPKDCAKRDGFTRLSPEGGRLVIGHSETGHHHVLGSNAGANVMMLDRTPEGIRVIYAILENPTSLDHLRGHDTHESIALPPGEYEFRIAREFDHYAELARQSAD